MSTLQPLYEVKERLESAAIAGTGLLGEDFRLRRSAENMKPLAAASPVFAKISSGLESLLAAPAEQRPTLLLDLLGLVDAVAYTQGSCGMSGELEDLPTAGGTYQQISYGQIQPLLTALTTTGSGRMEIIQSTWEAHPEYFTDFRVLPTVVAGLGDSYGEIAELNTQILKKTGSAVLPMLQADFDPAGGRAMARRVEVAAAVGGPEATPWLREILPEAKKDVRTAALLALGVDRANTGMLLELAKLERGKNRDAVLEALAKQDGEAVQKFWAAELKKNSCSVKFLRDTDTEWAAALVASGLRELLERMAAAGGPIPAEVQTELSGWCFAIGKKTSPPMLDFWCWACGQMEAFDGFRNEKDGPIFMGVRLTDSLLYTLCVTGPGPVCDFCLNVWRENPNITRYLIHSFLASLMVRPAAEVYDTYARYILTGDPGTATPAQRTLNNVLLRALTWVTRREELKCYWVKENSDRIYLDPESRQGVPTAEPLDRRWIPLLTSATLPELAGKYAPYGGISGGEVVCRFDILVMDLIDREDPGQCAEGISYFRRRMLEIPPEKGRGADSGGAYAYSFYLVQLGGSPKGVLGEAMAQRPGRHYAYYFWHILSEVSKSLPAEEVAQMMEEVQYNICFRKEDLTLLGRAVPATTAALRAGKPFPEWDEWWKMR